MSRPLLASLLFAALSAVPVTLPACGNAAPPPATPSASSSASASASAVASASVAPPPMPIDPFARFVVPNALFVARLELRTLRIDGAIDRVHSMLDKLELEVSLTKAQPGCDITPIEAIDRLQATGDDEGMIVVVRPAVAPERFLRCARAMRESKDTVIEHHDAVAFGTGEIAITEIDGAIVAGSVAKIEAALRATAPVPAPRSRVAEGAGKPIVELNFVDRAGEARFWFVIGAKDATSWIDTSLDFDDVDLADAVARGLDGLFRTVAEADVKDDKLLHASLDGDHATAHYDAPAGTAIAETEVKGLSAGLTIAALYLRRAATVEAVRGLGELTADYKTAVESTRDKKGKTHLLAAAPPVPAKVPRGVAVHVDDAEWVAPTWRLLGFHPKEHVHYQYAIENSKDGRHATLFARGDLDGDGDVSTYSIMLTLDAKGNVIVGPLVKSKPLE